MHFFCWLPVTNSVESIVFLLDFPRVNLVDGLVCKYEGGLQISKMPPMWRYKMVITQPERTQTKPSVCFLRAKYLSAIVSHFARETVLSVVGLDMAKIIQQEWSLWCSGCSWSLRRSSTGGMQGRHQKIQSRRQFQNLQ